MARIVPPTPRGEYGSGMTNRYPAAMTAPSPPDSPDFVTLGLSPALARRAASAGWRQPNPIQAAVVPPVLQGRDVLGLAPTGSGKTAAYLLPLLHRQHTESKPADAWTRRLRVLVLAPTRELAVQIGAAIHALAPQLKCVVAVGGRSINPQLMALRGGADWVIATPGRLLDLLDHNGLRLSGLDSLVLDEADRLLGDGFADEVGRVLAALPPRHQTLMFSATMPAAVVALASKVLRDQVTVDLTAQASTGLATDTLPAITQRAIEVDTARRTPLLRHLLATPGWKRVLVFVATQYSAEHVADKLRQHGVAAQALHGRLAQGRRGATLDDFQRGRLAVLVATDLAARGLDIAGLPVVLNYDLPRSALDYTHRIGRTGRAGMAGQAVSFICADVPGSVAHFALIEKRQRHTLPRERITGFEPEAPPPPEPGNATPLRVERGLDPNGGIKGRRKSKKDKLREAAARGPPMR